MEDAALPTKIICLMLLGAISMSCGLLPLLLFRLARRWRRWRTEKTEMSVSGRIRVLLSCVLCLGGGVLLGTVFTHMLPEIRDIFLQIEGANLLPGIQPPTGEIFICAGFFLVYLVEELVHAFLASRASAKKKRDVVPAPVATSPSAVVVEVHGDRDAMSWHEKYAEPAALPPPSAPVTDSGHDHGSGGHDHGSGGHDHGSGGHDHGSVVASLHALRAYIVIVALSVHAVFEGLAVAFETTSRDVWVLFAAIATHKAVVVFCLGEQLMATKRSVCFVVSNVVILSAASPLGVTIGLAVEQLDQDETSRLLATGLLQAVAAGTILYVVFFEILGPERQKHGAGLLKFFAVVAGFVLVVLVHSSGGHSHGGPAHGLPAGVHDHSGVDVHGHGNDHDHNHAATEKVNSDYLARVPSESGHVYNTVRYIKSFNRQEPPTVDAGDIVAGMRSIVEDLGRGRTHHEHSHDGEEGEVVGMREDSDHSHEEDDNRKQPRPQRFNAGHTEDEDGLDEHGHEEDYRDSGSDEDIEPDAREEQATVEGAHHHDHDQFMRTVEDLAGQLGGLDRQAVDRTVALIDTLDLIAMKKTDMVHRTDHGRNKDAGRDSPQGGQSESDHNHGHEQDDDDDHDHDHGHDHGQDEEKPSSDGAVSGSRSAAAVTGRSSRDGERRWLHAAHFGEPMDAHVHFVLQNPRAEPSPVGDPTPAPGAGLDPSTSAGTSSSANHRTSHQQELDAERELDHMEEVRFHTHGDHHTNEQHTHAPALRSPTSAQPGTVT